MDANKLAKCKSRIIENSKNNLVRTNLREIAEARAHGYTWASIAKALGGGLDEKILPIYFRRFNATVVPTVAADVVSGVALSVALDVAPTVVPTVALIKQTTATAVAVATPSEPIPEHAQIQKRWEATQAEKKKTAFASMYTD